MALTAGGPRMPFMLKARTQKERRTQDRIEALEKRFYR
jgi:hypothetical protein